MLRVWLETIHINLQWNLKNHPFASLQMANVGPLHKTYKSYNAYTKVNKNSRRNILFQYIIQTLWRAPSLLDLDNLIFCKLFKNLKMNQKGHCNHFRIRMRMTNGHAYTLGKQTCGKQNQMFGTPCCKECAYGMQAIHKRVNSENNLSTFCGMIAHE